MPIYQLSALGSPAGRPPPGPGRLAPQTVRDGTESTPSLYLCRGNRMGAALDSQNQANRSKGKEDLRSFILSVAVADKPEFVYGLGTAASAGASRVSSSRRLAVHSRCFAWVSR